VLTITDRGFWKTLHPGWLRHGVAEIIKMAVMKDLSLFELMEKHGARAVATKFGTEGDSVNDAEFQDVCDLIVGKAMEGYVRSEYGNLWETHQCRPHAYGHTWSPGYELPAGMLHGQSVGTCMGLGAYLSFLEGWVSEEEMHRILKVISDCELSLYHPIMDDSKMVWKTQVSIVEKRGGNLCAPIPKPLGFSGYLNDLSEEMLEQRLREYKAICAKYPREGRGVEEHCVDVGLEDPQAKKMQRKAEKDAGSAEKVQLLEELRSEGLISAEAFEAKKAQLAA
jgi:3-dehydroquinate synthase